MCSLDWSGNDDKIDSELEQYMKKTVEHFGFLKSQYHEATWQLQIKNIDRYWDDLIHNIDIEDFMDTFSRISKFNPKFHDAHIPTYLELSLTEWRIELMTRVANRIGQFITDEITGEYVIWDGADMKFLYDGDIC